MMKLPTILSGPILRRVEKENIYIWVATSTPFNINTNLFTINRGLGNETFIYNPISHTCTTTSIQFGRKLFIHLIKLTPEFGLFPTDTLLGYNLFFQDNSNQLDLGSLGMLSSKDPNSIVYGGLQYPSFFITESERPILYGSCRKLHAEGDDALAAGDDAIWESYLNLEKRPSSLFLVGDQIYADDVAEQIAPFVYRLGNELIGENALPLTSIDKSLKNEPYKSNLFKINGRKPIMDDLCKFTSRKSENHLITIGEFAALYLFSWSPQIWGIFEKAASEELNQENNYFNQNSLSLEIDGNETYGQAQQELQFKKLRKEIISFRNALPQIRRLLANIPTYMIFDDHDVTDDWNISLKWKENVWKAPLGKHVIANGLAAYWAFQGWGNSPDQFDSQFLSIMQAQLAQTTFDEEAYQKWVKLLWGFNSWSFIAPTTPTTVFLDTRTQRAFPDESVETSFRSKIKQSIHGPELVSEEAWKQVTKQLERSKWKQGSRLIVVSPVPFYGIDIIETFLKHYISPLKLLGIPVKTLFDMEAWKYNGKGFTHFLRTINSWNPSLCIILSGDAHTASSAISQIQQKNGRGMTLIQFTSSPLNNPTFSGLPGLLLKGAVWFFEKISGSNSPSVNRCCDTEYTLFQTSVKKITPTPNMIWSEDIRYLPMIKSGGLIKTKNNLGHLSFNTQRDITNIFMEKRSKK